MLTVSGHTLQKRAFIQTAHTMPLGANAIFICTILMAMSFRLLVRSSLKSHTLEIPVFRYLVWVIAKLTDVWDGQIELTGAMVGYSSEVDEVFKSARHSFC